MFKKSVKFKVINYDNYQEMEELISVGWYYVGDQLWIKNDNTLNKSIFLPKFSENELNREGIVLTFPKLSDLDIFYKNDRTDLVRQHAIFSPLSEKEIENAIIDSYPRWRFGNSTFLVARENINGPALAKLAIRRLVPPNILDVGYVTMDGYRGKGVASTALKIFTGWAFEKAGMQRIELGIKPKNIQSIRTAQKSGYQLESIRHARLINHDNSFDDEYSYVAIRNKKDSLWENIQ